jgi:DNA-binding response OmpR family regulator
MKRKILIVDDEPEVLEVLKKKLEAENFIVITASDGLEGLKQVKTENPDLILLDVIMPNKDGFAMLNDLQADEKLRKIPVIMATAKGDSSSVFNGQYLGAIDYLIKPIDFRQLLKYINRYS